MENFFKADGLTKIMFYYQEVDNNLPEAGEKKLNKYAWFAQSSKGLQFGDGVHLKQRILFIVSIKNFDMELFSMIISLDQVCNIKFTSQPE